MSQSDIALDPMAGTAKNLAQRGRSARMKGQKFERIVANMLTEATGTLWKRKVRQHGNDSDVVTDDPAFQHISIECKHADRLCLPLWWRQAQAQAGKKIPMLIYRQTGGAIYVQLDAYNVNSWAWPVIGRHSVTLDWDGAMQWLREMAKPLNTGDCTVLGE